MKYYVNGAPKVESTGETEFKKAGRRLDAVLTAVKTGDYLSPQDRKITVAELWEGLLTDYRKNGREEVRQLEIKWELRLKAAFGNLRVMQVTTDRLNAYVLKQQAEGLSNSTINKDMANLKRAFNLGYRCTPKKVKEVPVFPGRLKEAPPRKGFVEDGTYNKLAANAGSLWLLAVAYASGFRREELLSMKVEQIDLLARTITLHVGETKNDEGRVVKMTQEVFLLLQACCHGKGPEDRVLTRAGQPIIDIRDAWAEMCKKAGVSGIILHDFRRSAIRNMVRRGIPERVAMMISGHKDKIRIRPLQCRIGG